MSYAFSFLIIFMETFQQLIIFIEFEGRYLINRGVLFCSALCVCGMFQPSRPILVEGFRACAVAVLWLKKGREREIVRKIDKCLTEFAFEFKC